MQTVHSADLLSPAKRSRPAVKEVCIGLSRRNYHREAFVSLEPQVASGFKPVWQDAHAVIEPQINAESVHVWPFNKLFPVDVRFLTFGQEQSIRANRHDYFELFYQCTGRLVYQVQDRYFDVSAGDLFIVGSTHMHRHSSYPAGRVQSAVLYFLPELIRTEDASGDGAEYLMPFLVQDADFCHVVPAASGIPKEIFDLMKRVAAELPAASNRSRLSVKTYLKMMLVLLMNHYSAYRGDAGAFQQRHAEIQRLRPLFDYLDLHFAQPISVDAAAAILHMSKSSFMRFFKRVTGETFVEYLNRFRIAKAEALLRDPRLSVAEVGLRVGFCDQSYFGLVFRNLLNVTPREYKQRLEAQAR